MNDLHRSFAQLVQELEAARTITEKATDVDARRARLGDVNAAVVSFLRREGVPTQLYQPLIALNAALIDVEEGRHNPLLEPAKMPAGAERKLRRDMQQLGTASALVDILKDELRMGGATAHREAAKAINVEWTVLRDFRKTVRSGKAPGSAVEAYNMIKEDLRRSPTYSPKEGADFIRAKLMAIEKG